MRLPNNTRKYKSRFLAAGVLMFLAFATRSAPLPLAPERMVEEVTTQVTERLSSAAVTLEHDVEFVKTIVADLVLPHFDFSKLSAAILAGYWEQLSEGEKRCMTNGIRERLVERYSRVLLEYDYNNIVTNPLEDVSRSAPIYVTQTVTTPHPEPLALKYKMEFGGNSWSVVDLIVADVSLEKSYRHEFAEKIAADGIGDFLRTIPQCRER